MKKCLSILLSATMVMSMSAISAVSVSADSTYFATGNVIFVPEWSLDTPEYEMKADGDIYTVKIPVEKEKAFIRGNCDNPNGMMILCLVDGKIAGNCQIAFRTDMKECHRASVAIGLLQEYWNLGIGTRMFEELIRTARARDGIRQIELDFIEGNSRARGLYEKMGFRITGVKPDAIRMRDGTFVNEYMMIRRL